MLLIQRELGVSNEMLEGEQVAVLLLLVKLFRDVVWLFRDMVWLFREVVLLFMEMVSMFREES